MLVFIAAACGDEGPGESTPRLPPDAQAVDVVAAFESHGSQECSGRFVARDLDHITVGPGNTASTFDGTGAGVAIGDLDNDGDLDLVMASLSGDTNLFWNDGSGSFDREPLIEGRFRQASIVDVEGDGDRDVVLTTGIGPPVFFENLLVDGGLDDSGLDHSSLERGGASFERVPLPGVEAATYALAWGDLGGDGDLDVVTGSYNAELTILRNSPVLGSDTGVVVHEQADDGSFVATRVASSSQALSVLLVDLDGDFATDIAVGNDLATPDGLWVDNDGGWLAVEPFSTTSFSTMSLDGGDIDNDGDIDVFSTDMKPRSDDADADERYVEVNADMDAIGLVDDVQRPENVLSLATGESFDSAASEFGIDATGWSWSGVFGDLDSDGLLDLYVVTGMRSDNLFAALDNAELIEPNQAFVNTGSSMEREPSWGLDDVAGGRGMAMGDLDGDGDLDIVVNNLGSPSRVFDNEICGGSNLGVQLRWEDSRNLDAVGATVIASLADGRQLTRTIDLSRGYLSGGPPHAHFGLGSLTESADSPVELTVIWPDGSVSETPAVEPNQLVTIMRSGT